MRYFKCPVPSLVKIYLMVMTKIAPHRLKFIQEPIFLTIFPLLVIFLRLSSYWSSELPINLRLKMRVYGEAGNNFSLSRQSLFEHQKAPQFYGKIKAPLSSCTLPRGNCNPTFYNPILRKSLIIYCF